MRITSSYARLAPQLQALSILALLFTFGTICDEVTGAEDATLEDEISFTSSGTHLKESQSLTSEDPTSSFSADVTITSTDAIDPGDVQAWIKGQCQFGTQEFFEIPLRENGLTSLRGSSSANGRFCIGPGGQRETVTWNVVIQRNTPIAFRFHVSASGG